MLKIIKTLDISQTSEPTNSESTDAESKVVALTFDDRPNPYATPQYSIS